VRVAKRRFRKAEALSFLRSTEGLDLLPGRVTGKEASAHLQGMVQRVRHRAWRRTLGLPVAPLHANDTCVVCGGGTREGKPSHPDAPEFPRWRGEWVEVHVRCRDQLAPTVEVCELRGGECFVLSES